MTTTTEVKDAFAALPNAHIDEVDIDGQLAEVTVSDNLAGQFFGTLRRNGFDYNAKRLGSRLVAHIEVEEEETNRTLGELFR